MKIPKDYHLAVKLKPKEIKTIIKDAFKDDYYVIEEIHAIWQPGVRIFFYFDGALTDVFETLIPFQDGNYYKFSRVFNRPLIVFHDIEVSVINDSDVERDIEIYIDGYLAPKDKYIVKS